MTSCMKLMTAETLQRKILQKNTTDNIKGGI